MQEAIHKMTELPAKRMKYKDRGVLKAGYFADILIFDPSIFVTMPRSLILISYRPA